MNWNVDTLLLQLAACLYLQYMQYALKNKISLPDALQETEIPMNFITIKETNSEKFSHLMSKLWHNIAFTYSK